MTQASEATAGVSPFTPDEERVILVLAQADRSLTLPELSARLETPDEDLHEAMRSLYRRHFLLVSRGIGQIEDTYLLSQPARAYARLSLLPDAPRALPIDARKPAAKDSR